MIDMRDGEVRGEDGHGITEDQVFISIKKTTLPFRKMIQAKKTSSFLYILFSHIGRAALHSTGIVLEANGKSVAGDIAFSYFLE
jgi:hypothetical protein